MSKPRARKATPSAAQLTREQRKAAREGLRLARMNLTTARVDARDVFRALPQERKRAIAAIRDKAKSQRAKLRALYALKLANLRSAVAIEIAAVRMHVKDAKAKARQEIEIRKSAVRRARAIVDQYLTEAQRSARARARSNLTDMGEAFERAASNIEHELPGAVPAFRKYARSAQARSDYKRALSELKRRHPRGDYHPSDAGEALAVWWLERMSEQARSGQSYAAEEAAAIGELQFSRAEEAASRCGAEAQRRWELARTPEEQAEVEAFFNACTEDAWKHAK